MIFIGMKQIIIIYDDEKMIKKMNDIQLKILRKDNDHAQNDIMYQVHENGAKS